MGNKRKREKSFRDDAVDVYSDECHVTKRRGGAIDQNLSVQRKDEKEKTKKQTEIRKLKGPGIEPLKSPRRAEEESETN